MSDVVAQVIDPKWYREVLAQYPTGVCVITSVGAQGEPLAMIVGSFTSVSLHPPLVAFFPARDSNSWAKLRHCESFCVNILSSRQEAVCRQFASKDANKFGNTAHRLSRRGNPILDGVVAWIDCRRYSVNEAGDHDIVLGEVLELDVASEELPLLFFQGGYGRFAPATLAASDSPVLNQTQLTLVDRARPIMETMAESIRACCIATARAETELVVAASVGRPRNDLAPMLVGQRLPFRPPTGAIFAAWLPERERQTWLEVGRRDSRLEEYLKQLITVRDRGYSVGLLNDAQRAFVNKLGSLTNMTYESHHGELQRLISALSYDPPDLTREAFAAVRLVSAPIFNDIGNVVMALTLYSFPKPDQEGGVMRYVVQLVKAAADITQSIGGQRPPHVTGTGL
jgi:flavin reductase (DIM6/NTAB) family NADH-FMN oxidoreductase RutF/DNA-binding IclR family transcriptional regulator